MLAGTKHAGMTDCCHISEIDRRIFCVTCGFEGFRLYGASLSQEFCATQ